MISDADLERGSAWTTGEDERHDATTADGWRLALYRYRGTGRPVVCGHGLAGSRWIFDVHAECSIARALAARGHDVWLVDLRGRGDSWPAGGPRDELQWSFDDFVERDLPAVCAQVLEVTGADDVAWIGTEMSGLAAYAAVISATAPLARVVTLGSPVITPPDAQVPGVTTPYPERDGTRYGFSMVRAVGARLAADRSEMLESSFRPIDTDWTVTARYFTHGVPDEATDLIDQFTDWVTNATMRSGDHSVVWSERLAEFRVPVLVAVGAADLQRPAPAVRATFDALGSPDKRLLVAGTAAGWPCEVGHDDLLAGLASPTHLYPVLDAFLRER
jgi:pimeloyl-ACP methyl ester carboxylesterase